MAGSRASVLAVLLALGVAVPVSTPGLSAQAAPADEGTTAVDLQWRGRLAVTSTMETVSDLGTRTNSGEATYTDLVATGVPQAETADGLYAAQAVVDFDETFVSEDCDVVASTTMSWEFAGPTTSTVDGAGNPMSWADTAAFVLTDDVGTGHTYLTPRHVNVTGEQGYTCGGPGPPLQAYSFGAYEIVGTYPPSQGEWLADDDPDPDHLVGTTTWSSPPTGDSADDYSSYSFTATYDLRRVGVPVPADCDDGEDDDGDGLSDLSDPGCDSPDDVSELATTACDNGTDDDGDGEVDWRSGSGGDGGCYSLTDDDERGACAPVSDESATYRAVTDLDNLADAHWYTTTVTASTCDDNGTTYLTGLSVDRHVEGGPLPTLIGAFGWSSGTETEVRYDQELGPDQPARFASASFTYTACFDLTEVWGIGKLKSAAMRSVERPLAKALAKILRKAGIRRFDRPTTKKAVAAFRKTAHRLQRRGYISGHLQKELRVPAKIADHLEKLVYDDWVNAIDMVKSRAKKASYKKSRLVEGQTAEAAAEALVGTAFGKITRLFAFCGGRTAASSAFLTWHGDVAVTAAAGEVQFYLSNVYVNPFMEIR